MNEIEKKEFAKMSARALAAKQMLRTVCVALKRIDPGFPGNVFPPHEKVLEKAAVELLFPVTPETAQHYELVVETTLDLLREIESWS